MMPPQFHEPNVMPTFPGRILLIYLAAFCLLIAIAGCGATTPKASDSEDLHLKVLGLLYGQFMSRSSGKAPASQEEFAKYLQSESANWEKFAKSAEEFLEKSGDGGELVVLYGKRVQTPAEGGLPWIAYKKQLVEGKYRIVNARGYVRLVDKQEFDQLFPAAQ